MTTPEEARPRWDQAARRWWSRLQDTREDGTPNRGRDRAALARLGRVSTPMQAIEEPAIFDLYGKFGFTRQAVDFKLSRVAVVASVLAHVKADARATERGFRPRVAAVLGQGERPPMSNVRFKRLLAARSDQDLLIQFRRAVALLGARNIDVGDLAASLLTWDDDRRRMRWAFDYYGAGFAAPNLEIAVSPDDED